jgi:hypothetical protein
VQRTGIVANELAADKKENADELVQSLEKAVNGSVRLAKPLPEPAYLVAPLLDALVSFDEIGRGGGTGGGWSLLPAFRTETGERLSYGLPYGGPERIVMTGLATEAEAGLKGSRRSAPRQARPGDDLFRAVCDLMSNGARTILLTRWRTGGQTNIDLVREFLRELPESPATEAWQRACLLARESPLDAAHEPRLKRLDDTALEPPTADHPFFWAGYILVDTSPSPDAEQNAEQPAAEMVDQPRNEKLPPPVDAAQPSRKPFAAE